MRHDRRHQRGAILAAGLMMLLIVTVLAYSGMSEATLEMAKIESVKAAEHAFFAAETGIATAMAEGDFSSTAPQAITGNVLADGDRYTATVRHIGISALDESQNTAGWVAFHFLIEATGQSVRGAVAVHRQQVYVIGPTPDDPDLCSAAGCIIRPICDPDTTGCESALRPDPVRVSWHRVEDAS